MKKLLIILPLVFLVGCSCFSTCKCTPEIEENEKLIIPPDLQKTSIISEKKE